MLPSKAFLTAVCLSLAIILASVLIDPPFHLYQNPSAGAGHAPEFTIFSVKPGEGLLVFFTLMLWLATRDLVKGAELTTQRQLRAYMGMMTEGTRPIGAAGHVAFYFTNYGQTPSHRVSMWCRILPNTSNTNEFDYSEQDIVCRNQITHPRQLFGQIIGTIRDPRERDCLVHGRIEYLDAFDHKWRFCFAYTHQASRGSDAWRVYHKHNYEEELKELTPVPDHS